MKCPECGQAELVAATRNLAYTYKGHHTTIRQVKGQHCPACKEAVLDASQGERYAMQVRAFQTKINAQYVDPAYITKVRKQLALDQREAAEIFGGGINAFSRYETGRTKPPLALVKLLQLLERHPKLLKEVRTSTP